MSESSSASHYREPGWFTKNVFNRLISSLTSGEWRSNPVNLLTDHDRHYLVAPRGETQWVRNLRVAGAGELRVGRRVQPFTSVELPDDQKADILRAYLKRWKMEVGVFFDGVSAASPDTELARIAPNHPVFEVSFREPL
jgi:hypothetical protein